MSQFLWDAGNAFNWTVKKASDALLVVGVLTLALVIGAAMGLLSPLWLPRYLWVKWRGRG